MICQITGNCISCGVCLLECPENAISVSEEFKYRINPILCNLCIGYHPSPICNSVCPIDDAIKLVPSYSAIEEDIIKN